LASAAEFQFSEKPINGLDMETTTFATPGVNAWARKSRRFIIIC